MLNGLRRGDNPRSTCRRWCGGAWSRGVGLGETMIGTALSQASKIGAWAIELEVFATNAHARRMYEKLDFATAGVVPKKIQRDGMFIDSVQMYLHLPHK